MVSEMVSGTVCKRMRAGVMGGTDILMELNTFIDEKWRSFYAAPFSHNSFNTVLQRGAQGLPFLYETISEHSLRTHLFFCPCWKYAL